MRIYVTNLPESKDRKMHIESQLGKCSLDFEFVDCVIGKELSDSQIAEACDLEMLRKHNREGEWFSKGMIGASLTSQRIHRKIVESGERFGLLLEDDVVLPSDFGKVLEDLESNLQDGDVALLFWLAWEGLELRSSTKLDFGSRSFFEPVNSYAVSAGAATVFSAKVAERLLEFNVPIRFSPDSWGSFVEGGCIDRILCAYPRVVEVGDFISTLEGGRFQEFRRFVYRHQVFPLYQIQGWLRRKARRKREHVTIR